MDTLKSIELKTKEGKSMGTYVEAHERVRYFRESARFIGWSLTTEIIDNTDKSVMMQAIVRNSFGVVVATGTAMERITDSFINKQSHIENCETSAWGRAMACLGIGIDEHVRSAEEMANAVENQEPMTSDQRAKISKLVATLSPQISQNKINKIFDEMGSFSPERADECIGWLEANQRNLLDHNAGMGDISKATQQAVDKDDAKDKSKK